MKPCNIQHMGNLLNPLTWNRQLQSLRPIQSQLRSWQLSCAEFILQSNNIDVVQRAIVIPDSQEDEANLSSVLLQLLKILWKPG